MHIHSHVAALAALALALGEGAQQAGEEGSRVPVVAGDVPRLLAASQRLRNARRLLRRRDADTAPRDTRGARRGPRRRVVVTKVAVEHAHLAVHGLLQAPQHVVPEADGRALHRAGDDAVLEQNVVRARGHAEELGLLLSGDVRDETQQLAWKGVGEAREEAHDLLDGARRARDGARAQRAQDLAHAGAVALLERHVQRRLPLAIRNEAHDGVHAEHEVEDGRVRGSLHEHLEHARVRAVVRLVHDGGVLLEHGRQEGEALFVREV
mmetsp:Transcript_14553/g.44364  ORF Transcript_14553/g.44364 Transcript_14553/m.44364 type:complete len:266 (+) Transcript_14553:1528-2325(+)